MRVHHVGLVVRRLEDGFAFWRDTLGLRVAKEATVRDQGVRAALPGSHAVASAGAFGGLALQEVTAGCRDAATAAGLFETKLGLARATGGTAVAAGGVTLRFVTGGDDGLSGLVLEVSDLAAAS